MLWSGHFDQEYALFRVKVRETSPWKIASVRVKEVVLEIYWVDIEKYFLGLR